MENNENIQITFEEVKELYKDMMRERAKEKYRLWDREYKRMRYEIDPEFREKQKQKAKERRERIKAISQSVTTS
jgi:polyhydroxyalkanoate synthesis regulator phasin